MCRWEISDTLQIEFVQVVLWSVEGEEWVELLSHVNPATYRAFLHGSCTNNLKESDSLFLNLPHSLQCWLLTLSGPIKKPRSFKSKLFWLPFTKECLCSRHNELFSENLLLPGRSGSSSDSSYFQRSWQKCDPPEFTIKKRINNNNNSRGVALFLVVLNWKRLHRVTWVRRLA